MSKLIILEGAQGAGKSTLALKLQREWQGPSYCLHFSKPGSTNPTDMFEHVGRALNMSNDHLIIFDRSWLSDIIYNPTDTKWSLLLIQAIEGLVMGSGNKLILLTGSYHTPSLLAKSLMSIETECQQYRYMASKEWIRCAPNSPLLNPETLYQVTPLLNLK